MDPTDRIETCPGCLRTGPQHDFGVDVVNVRVSPAFSLFDVGFRCPKCGTVWGHEVSA